MQAGVGDLSSDKNLCDMGMGTRSQVKELIRKGLVTIDGIPALRPEQKVEAEHAVCVNGKAVSYVNLEYYMLYKPAGYVSATEDRHCPTVLDLITGRQRKDLFPVGRLDKDTEGLLLITNDGELAHRLLSPKRHVDKTYYARIQGAVTQVHILAFAEGLDIGEEKLTLPAKLQILESGSESEILVTIREGKFHQVKRMFAAVGCEVLYLKRLSMGSLTLEESLGPGGFRPLTEAEIQALREETGCLPM